MVEAYPEQVEDRLALRAAALVLVVRAAKQNGQIPSYMGQRLAMTTHVSGRVQALLAKQASFDLGPELVQAGALLQSRLPYRVSSGVTLSGHALRLALRSVSVQPQGVVALTQAQGVLEAQVELKK